MSRQGTRPLTLDIEGDEITALKAAIASGLEELRHSSAKGSETYQRLERLHDEVERMAGLRSARLALQRQDAEALRSYVMMVISMRGYIVARPAAINALTALYDKLDHLLRGNRWAEMRRAIGEIMYGIFVYDSVRMFRRQESSLEHLFVLISFGDLLGVPVLPPYYTLRLLPYVAPLINGWRRRMLREKDLTDALF